ncbi:MAG: hypothetical protein IAC78_02165 [Firmicutes bacterium]|uniref:Uncharacterized protein n=1 Tax=Candidatus Scatoplasma merdavium TaxID=2840932 RepID=A0A9D9D956_9BACL|nr:hypothetical protein [Candidatus Scatoplasma merdavium]
MKNVYVVEGKTDEQVLLSIGCRYVYQVHGMQARNIDIEFLKSVQSFRKIVLLFDPDRNGKFLTGIFKSNLRNFMTLKIEADKCIKGKKVGIAEAEIAYLKEQLKGCLNYDNKFEENYDISKLKEIISKYDMKQILLALKKHNIDNLDDLGMKVAILNLNLEELEREIIDENSR